MIRKFLNSILNTEYLPMNDVRKTKIFVIFIFLIFFTGLTFPVSSLLDYTFWVKAIFMSGFVLALLLTFVFLKIHKEFFAMQTTIIQAVMFMVFYTQGITSFYAYLLFYIVLTIIAFYQEIYSYFIFGSFVTVLGVFYILRQGDGLLLSDDIRGAIYIYLVGLVLYYLVNFVFILVNEKSYAEMNLEWINEKKTNDSLQEDIFNHMETLRKIDGRPAIYDDESFQKSIYDLSEFVSKQIYKDGSEIKNIVDLYFYIHEKGYKDILDNQDISVNMRKTTINMKKYMINDNSDLFSLITNFFLLKQASDIDMDKLNVLNLSLRKDESLIAFALIYVYISNNLYQESNWNKYSSQLSEKNIDDYDFESFFDDDTLAFYLDNIDLIKKHLQ